MGEMRLYLVRKRTWEMKNGHKKLIIRPGRKICWKISYFPQGKFVRGC